MKTFTKHLRWLLASLMLVAGMSAWAQTDPYYTLDTTGSTQTNNNGYANTGTATVDGIGWTFTGNGTINPWRLGGKSLSNVDRTVYTNTAMGSAINKVVLTVGQASSITVNSLKLTVASDASFNTVLDEVSATFKASSDITFQPSTGTVWATGAYYKFTFNVTVSGNSNRFVQFSGVKFYAPTASNAVATPTFTPAAGTYASAQSVELNTTTAGATIYYTTDGTDPTTSSSVYSSAISVSTTTTIKAMAVKNGMDNSAVASATYNFVSIEHTGTAEDPYTVADARAAIDANTGITGVYATGIVSEIVTEYNSQYGNITYNITADGTTDGDFLQAYRGKSYNGDNFTSADDIQVGDEVVIFGTLKKYNTTYEFDANNQLVSLQRTAALSFEHTTYTATLGESFTTPTLNNPNSLSVTYSSSTEAVATINPSTGAITLVAAGMTTITAIAGNKTAHYKLFVIDPNNGIEANPYTVAQALEYIGHLGTETSPVDIYVSGIVSNAGLNGNYVVYYISDDGTDDTHLYVYGGKGLEGATLTNDDVQQGDEVTVCGKLVNYHGNTPEFTSGNQIVAFNRPEKENPGLSFGEATEYTITVGDEFTEPTLINPNQLSVTYSGDNNQLAMVDEDTGELTFVEGATGTIVVTATFAGNTQYNAGTATYTLTVEEEPAVVITPNPKNINSEYYEKVTDMSELEDGDAIILVVENGTASQAMGTTTTNGAYRPSYGLATNGTYDWENCTVQLSDEDKDNIEKIVLVKEGDLFYLYATRTATLTGFLYANNYGLYVDSNNTNLADNHKAAISIDATGNASITFQGDTTKPLFGRTSSGWSSFASGTTLDNMQIYVERSVSTPATGDYVKVESANDLTDGEYLIVYEDGSLAFDGSLETLDAVENTIGVTIGNKTIASSETVDAATFTIKATNNVYTIKSASGMYIGQTSDANGLQALDTALDNTIIIDTYGNADIISSGSAYLRYNATSGQERFRYFKSSTYTNQKAIALYKKQTAPDTHIATTVTLDPATASYNVTLGDAFTAPTAELDPAAAGTLTYESSNTDVAEVAADGAVTIKAAGTTTITAKFAGNDEYKPSQASYTINVTDPNAKGTETNPYTVAEAIAYIETLGTSTSPSEVYVSGIISQVGSYNSTYKSITYWISDDGETTTQMEVYSGKGLEGADFSAAEDLQKGDIVTIFGFVKKYSGTPEFDKNNKLVSFERPAVAVEAPVFSVDGGTYTEDQTVTITCATTGASIYYTLDGTEPTTASTPYTAALTISETTTLKAIASDGTNVSTVTTATYTINKVEKPYALNYGTEYYTKVTDLSQLENGDAVIIVSDVHNFAMSTTQQANNRKEVEFEWVPWIGGSFAQLDASSTIEKFIVVKEGEYFYFYASRGTKDGYIYMAGANNNSNYLRTQTTKNNNAKASVEVDANGNATIIFQGTDSKNTLMYNSSAGLFSCYSSGQQPVQLYVERPAYVSEADQQVTVADAQDCYKTFITPYDARFDGVNDHAYIVTLSADQKEAILKEVSVVPAGTPIIYKYETAGTHPITRAISGSDVLEDVSDNVLKVSRGEVTGDGTIFVLNNVSGIGFYRLNEGKTLGMGKCYIKVEQSAGVKFIGINFDGEATGIATVDSEGNVLDGPVFNLAGQRVAVPAHGLYIVNGKKVFIK